jgi:MGT family glycosyltransferase
MFPATVRGQLKDLQALLADEPADVLVGDLGLLAGPILQELGGPPFAAFGVTVVTYPDPNLAPFGLGLRPTSGRVGRVRNRMLTTAVRRLLFKPLFEAVNQIRRENGLATADIGLGYPAHAELFLQLGTAGFEYPREVPEILHYVGPSRPAGYGDWRPPAWWPQIVAADRPVVLVTQGTVAVDGGELLRPTLDALADQDVLVVAVTGGPDPAGLGPLPANARVERFVPFDRLLPHVDIYVTNGGFGGVQLALSHGVPIVAAGKTEDKAEVSARVAHNGVGIDLRTQHPKAGQIRSAVQRILAEPRYAEAARRIRAEINASGREDRAAELLEQLAVRRIPARQEIRT